MSPAQFNNVRGRLFHTLRTACCGWIETTGDALLILEAARRGLIPKETRFWVERKLITSGSVFVFDEDESGIERWTDGYLWDQGRILGNFLLYREVDRRGVGTNSEPSVSEKQREKTFLGRRSNAEKFKSDGLMKKTFSLSIGGTHFRNPPKVEVDADGVPRYGPRYFQEIW
ncbi:Gti1/Pac2 family-domain-containing protein [Mycena floridula]|nr:Gti1/Pac2 family-domain-containing protein [Mycena floridula]